MSPIAISPAFSIRDYSHYDVILIMTSLATELATPSVTDILPHFIYKDVCDTHL